MDSQSEKPKVYAWFIAFCVLMCLMYLFVFGMGLLFPSFAQYSSERQLEGKIVGPMYMSVGSIFLVAYGIAPFLKPGPGVWIYDLVLICLGMTSCCCLPITIPLLIFWIKPENKSYFGR